MQAVQGWHSFHPQKSRFFLFFCCSIQCMLALFSFCSPPYYNMAAVPPGFTSKFQAGRKRKKKESRKGYRVNRAGQLNLSPFLVEKPGSSWKPYPEIFCLLLTGQNHVLCSCCLIVTGGKGIFGQRLRQQPEAQYLHLVHLNIYQESTMCQASYQLLWRQRWIRYIFVPQEVYSLGGRHSCIQEIMIIQ